MSHFALSQFLGFGFFVFCCSPKVGGMEKRNRTPGPDRNFLPRPWPRVAQSNTSSGEGAYRQGGQAPRLLSSWPMKISNSLTIGPSEYQIQKSPPCLQLPHDYFTDVLYKLYRWKSWLTCHLYNIQIHELDADSEAHLGCLWTLLPAPFTE